MDALIGAVGVIVGAGLSTLVLRRQRGRKLDAEADVASATAADTISQTVKGLLIVMQEQLDRGRSEVVELRDAMDAMQVRCDAEMARCEAEIEELRAEVAHLTERLAAAGVPEEP